MEQALQILAEYQWWIYAVLGLIFLFYLRRAIVARRDGARSIFKLEQEQAHTRYRRSVMVSAVILVAIAAVFVVSNPFLAAAPVEEATTVPTPSVTNGPLAASTLTPTAPPPTITPTAQPTNTRPPRPVQPTDTPDVLETETPVVLQPAACPNPGVRITSPGSNQVIQGNLAIRGSANISSFQFYKVEIGPGTNPPKWTVIGQLHNSPVDGGVLETLNASAYAAGTYTLQLVVVDQTSNYPNPCRVTVTIQH
jgi:hypothetical protein